MSTPVSRMAAPKELSANDFRDRYFTKYETSSFPVFVLGRQELQKLKKSADLPTSETLTGKAGIALATIDENKLVKRDVSAERNVRAYSGNQPLSFFVRSDNGTAYDGGRFYLDADDVPRSVAPAVVGVPKECAAEFVPLLMDIFSKKDTELTKDEAKLKDALKASWFWFAGQGLNKNGLFTYDTNTTVPNGELRSLVRESLPPIIAALEPSSNNTILEGLKRIQRAASE
jgi:hypothetical protein